MKEQSYEEMKRIIINDIEKDVLANQHKMIEKLEAMNEALEFLIWALTLPQSWNVKRIERH